MYPKYLICSLPNYKTAIKTIKMTFAMALACLVTQIAPGIVILT